MTLAKAAPDANYIVQLTPSWGDGAAASATVDNSFAPLQHNFRYVVHTAVTILKVLSTHLV